MAARKTEPTTTRVGPSAMPRDANAGKRTPRSTAAAAVAWSCLVSRLEDAGLRKPPPLSASSPGRAQPVPLPLSATPPKQHGFSAGVASSPLRRSVRSRPLSWSSPCSQSLVLLARRQLCTSSLQTLAGRSLLSPAASLPVRRRPTAVRRLQLAQEPRPPFNRSCKKAREKKRRVYGKKWVQRWSVSPPCVPSRLELLLGGGLCDAGEAPDLHEVRAAANARSADQRNTNGAVHAARYARWGKESELSGLGTPVPTNLKAEHDKPSIMAGRVLS